MAEIPEFIRYNFLLFLLGLSLIVFPLYLIFEKDVKHISLPIMAGVGGYLLIQGIGYIKEEYDMEMEIKEMEFILKKYDFLKEIERQDPKMINEETKKKNFKELKNRINLK